MSTTIEKNLLFLRGSDSNMGCDLYFTDKRLAIVFSNKKTFFAPPAVLGFIDGYEAGKKMMKTKTINPDSQSSNVSIDFLMGQNKNNRAVAYEDLEYIRIHQARFGSNLTLKSAITGWRQFTPNEFQLKQLSLVLPTIATLNVKLIK